jgi:hypothetical protein
VPPNKTDQLQPVDDGLGREIKLHMGREEDVWLEDDDNLAKWENNQLTASDRRILLAQWYCAAFKTSLTGRQLLHSRPIACCACTFASRHCELCP